MSRKRQGSEPGPAAVIDLNARRKQEAEREAERRLEIQRAMIRERLEFEGELDEDAEDELTGASWAKGHSTSQKDELSGEPSLNVYPVTRLEPGKLPQVLSPEDAPNKREHLDSLLDEGRVQIRLDPRRAAVEVPGQFQDDAVLALNLSWRFPNTHMVLNERGIAATLRFGGEPFRCQIPWHAIWGIAPPDSDWLVVWTGDLPAEFGGPPNRSSDALTAVEPRAPKLSVLKTDEAELGSAHAVDPKMGEGEAAGPEVSDSGTLDSEASDSKGLEPKGSDSKGRRGVEGTASKKSSDSLVSDASKEPSAPNDFPKPSAPATADAERVAKPESTGRPALRLVR